MARATRTGDPDLIRDARRDYYTQKLAEHITAVVAKAPPLNPDQLEHLRSLLNPPSMEQGAA